MMTMPAYYFETHFRLETPITDWPDEFIIITGYNPYGTQRPHEEHQVADELREAVNQAIDEHMEMELERISDWLVRITGYSPTTSHAEPGWAFVMPLSWDWKIACDYGHRFNQNAIYHVKGDVLSVTYCDESRELVPVGEFRARL